MTSTYYAILTDAGRALVVDLLANESTILISEMAYGDGNGSYYAPVSSQTSLKNEVGTRLSSLTKSVEDDGWVYFTATIPAETSTSFTIREIGLYTDTGVLVAIANIPDLIKPVLDSGAVLDIPLTIAMSATDASVFYTVNSLDAYAKIEYVDDLVTSHNTSLTAHTAMFPRNAGSLYSSNGTNIIEITANTDSTRKYLSQVGSGTPTWEVVSGGGSGDEPTLSAADMPITSINTSSAFALDFAAGDCYDIGLTTFMRLSSAITAKSILTAWASGSATGGLIPMDGYTNSSGVYTVASGYTVARAGAWYACLMITNTLTNTTDVCYVLSTEVTRGVLTSQGLAAIAARTGWDVSNIVYRRVWSINYYSSSTGILPYYPEGDTCYLGSISTLTTSSTGTKTVNSYSPYGEICELHGTTVINGFTNQLQNFYSYNGANGGLCDRLAFGTTTLDDWSSSFDGASTLYSTTYVRRTGGNGAWYVYISKYVDKRNARGA